LAKLKNGSVRLHNAQFLQRGVPDTIAPHHNPQELRRAPLMLCDG
jgi:hypothetical protein